MKCPNCGTNDNNGVYRTYPVLNMYVRERVCDDCGRKFYTKEEIYDKKVKGASADEQPELEFGKGKGK